MRDISERENLALRKIACLSFAIFFKLLGSRFLDPISLPRNFWSEVTKTFFGASSTAMRIL